MERRIKKSPKVQISWGLLDFGLLDFWTFFLAVCKGCYTLPGILYDNNYKSRTHAIRRDFNHKP